MGIGIIILPLTTDEVLTVSVVKRATSHFYHSLVLLIFIEGTRSVTFIHPRSLDLRRVWTTVFVLQINRKNAEVSAQYEGCGDSSSTRKKLIQSQYTIFEAPVQDSVEK